MEEHEDYTKIRLMDEGETPDRRGCAAIAAALAIIVLFLVVVGSIYLFT